MADMADPRRPTEHHLQRPSTLRTTTPQAPQQFASMAAEVSAIEQLITEALVAQERRLMLRLETHGKAQESAELTMARRSARRRGALATTLGVAAGTMLVVFSTAWTTYRDYRRAAETAAVEVVEAKQDPLVARVAANEEQLESVSRDIGVINRKVDALARSIARLVDEIEAEETPQARRRPR